ncbi:MAG: hypothetical protein NZM25_03255 [Leptospiraceae bacterium]|nr:hypothetical protein [Leptospiraceae bacterium]MDW8306004.1 hypothetical protein [Leptospiraceae bacterium]
MKDFIQQVEDAIHGGVVSLESLHKQFSEAIFAELAKIEPIATQVAEFKENHDRLISGLYELVRNANKETAKFAKDLAEKWEPRSS